MKVSTVKEYKRAVGNSGNPLSCLCLHLGGLVSIKVGTYMER